MLDVYFMISALLSQKNYCYRKLSVKNILAYYCQVACTDICRYSRTLLKLTKKSNMQFKNSVKSDWRCTNNIN